MGSLDCMHTWWKNCPKAWQGSFIKGKGKPSIVLEAACDHHLWFWHASYGYTGLLNDINIINMFHFQTGFLGGTFAEVEEQSGIIPYTINYYELMKMYFLVDGIYL